MTVPSQARPGKQMRRLEYCRYDTGRWEITPRTVNRSRNFMGIGKQCELHGVHEKKFADLPVQWPNMQQLNSVQLRGQSFVGYLVFAPINTLIGGWVVQSLESIEGRVVCGRICQPGTGHIDALAEFLFEYHTWKVELNVERNNGSDAERSTIRTLSRVRARLLSLGIRLASGIIPTLNGIQNRANISQQKKAGIKQMLSDGLEGPAVQWCTAVNIRRSLNETLYCGRTWFNSRADPKIHTTTFLEFFLLESKEIQNGGLK
ncbi:hypothetical protein C8R43DRAFT_958464 [Mycena crocata]|nr:hypothetical protein C8R43DRAFT_958464 [Mycena crocata]